MVETGWRDLHSPNADYAGFDRVDVVVEAVVENPKVKKSSAGRTEQKVRPIPYWRLTPQPFLSKNWLTRWNVRKMLRGMHFNRSTEG